MSEAFAEAVVGVPTRAPPGLRPVGSPPVTCEAGDLGATGATGRRAVLAVGAAGLLAACSGAPPDAPRGVTPSGSSSARVTTRGADRDGGPDEPDEDADLLAEAREAVAGAAALVAAARRSAPTLRGDLTPLLRLHEAHAEALGRPLADVPVRRRAAPPGPLLALVRDREQRLQALLVELAVRAGSGSLARLLASMSAGLAQRLVVLPTTAGGGA